MKLPIRKLTCFKTVSADLNSKVDEWVVGYNSSNSKRDERGKCFGRGTQEDDLLPSADFVGSSQVHTNDDHYSLEPDLPLRDLDFFLRYL